MGLHSVANVFKFNRIMCNVAEHVQYVATKLQEAHTEAKTVANRLDALKKAMANTAAVKPLSTLARSAPRATGSTTFGANRRAATSDAAGAPGGSVGARTGRTDSARTREEVHWNNGQARSRPPLPLGSRLLEANSGAH